MQNHSFISKPENQQADECLICGQRQFEHIDYAARLGFRSRLFEPCRDETYREALNVSMD